MRYMHRDHCHSSTLGCTPRRDNSCVLTEESHRLRDNLDIIIMLHGILTEGRVVLTQPDWSSPKRDYMSDIHTPPNTEEEGDSDYPWRYEKVLKYLCMFDIPLAGFLIKSIVICYMLLAVRPKFGSAFPAGYVL